MTISGVCFRCKKKSKDLVWSESVKNMVDWGCLNKIIAENKAEQTSEKS